MAEQEEHAPYFSIIIPTYNRAKLIQNTLQTVLQQKFQNYEVIIVDNCSTDNTVQELQEYLKDSRFKLIVNPKNLERAGARNVGFRSAKGKYLTLLDSDDFMYPDNLYDAYEFSKTNPAIKFFHNWYELVDENRKRVRKYSFPKSKNHVKSLAKGNFVSCIGVFLHKDIYKEQLFDVNPKVLGSEDWELWLRVIAQNKLGTIPKINNGILQHPQRSINHYNLEEIIERKLYIIDKILSQTNTAKVFKKYKKLMLASAHIFTAVQANDSQKHSLAFKYLLKSLKIRPSTVFSFRFMTVLKNVIYQ